MAADSASPEVAGYSSPKRGILLLLKRRPDASLEEIAHELGVSKVAALGHLQKLETDGLVERSYQAGRVGRPRVHFRLSPGATALFPQGYTEMSLCALEFIERRLGRTAVAELLAQRASEVADRHRTRLSSGGLAQRVGELAQIRSEGGYMAEVASRRAGSVGMVEHNCPILAIASRFPEACETERRMFESLLRANVEVSHRVVAGDPVCRFLVREKKAPP
jgi:DeoR family transcriptional regulator, suf operon transcriptional repressor